MDEFLAEVAGTETAILMDRPLSAGCLVTGRCNLRCEFCYGNLEALPTEELGPADWHNAFERLRQWGLMRVDLSGGEPFVRKDTEEIAAAAVSAGLNVVISTNAMLLTEARIASLPEGVRLHVSVDSGFAELHERSRINSRLLPSIGSFDVVMDIIRSAVLSGVRVRVMTCVAEHNVMGLFRLAEMLADAGVSEWNISRVLAAGRAISHPNRWRIADEAVVRQLGLIRTAFPWIRVRFSNRTDSNGYFLLVLPNGALATQYTDGRDKVQLGMLASMSVDDLRSHPDFSLHEHGRKWIAASIWPQITSAIPAA